jgi:hypothetical protein
MNVGPFRAQHPKPKTGSNRDKAIEFALMKSTKLKGKCRLRHWLTKLEISNRTTVVRAMFADE